MTAARTWGVGVVGLGGAARAHIDALATLPGVRVVAACARRARDPAETPRPHGMPLEVRADFGALLADPAIDVIDVCTPHPLHAEQAIAAARAGKHLIIEKPIALSYEDACAVRDAIRAAGVQACVCFECRFSSHFGAVRALIAQGLLGTLHYGEVDYFHGIGPWSRQWEWNVKRGCGGSSLLTAGCHALDGLLMFMNGAVEEVTSYATRSASPLFAPYEFPTTSTTILRFRNGAVGKVASVIDCLQPYKLALSLVGSEGSVRDDRFHSTRLALSKDRWSTLGVAPLDSGDVREHPYQPQFRAFFDALTRSAPMPLTDFDTAFETHRVAFAADRSAAQSRPVRLDELP